MKREMLRAKIHRITVTERDVEYEGSLALDADLMKACDMVPFEKIDVYDVDNGNRFSTYLIEGGPGSMVCSVNGAAAHLVEVGDKLILCAYATVDEADVPTHRPKVILVTGDNRIKVIKETEAEATRV